MLFKLVIANICLNLVICTTKRYTATTVVDLMSDLFNETDLLKDQSNNTMDYLFLEKDSYGTSILNNQQQMNKSERNTFNVSENLLNGTGDFVEESVSVNKNIPVTLLQHLHPVAWWKPVSEKINKIVAILKHPNDVFGSHYFWKKLLEKNEALWNGAHNAIYGLGHQGIQDYPFAYRNGYNYSNFK